MNSSLERDSPEMRRIQKACKEHSIFVVLGYSEKDMGSLYISQVGISISTLLRFKFVANLFCIIRHSSIQTGISSIIAER
jgi:uncharacterized protein YaeQ